MVIISCHNLYNYLSKSGTRRKESTVKDSQPNDFYKAYIKISIFHPKTVDIHYYPKRML